MSAKYIYNLSDENPDLKKQIGCMNGIFHVFDRYHFLGGGRRSISQTQKLPASGQKGKSSEEPAVAAKNSAENSHKNGSRENQRNSTESSRASFSSSSCSSSISSLECSKTHQLDPSSLSQADIPKSCKPDSMMHHKSNDSMLTSKQGIDFQCIVKDSIYRETRCISLKTSTKEESRGQTLKYIDSPRPLQNANTVNPRFSGLKESSCILHRLQQAPQEFTSRKNCYLTSTLKDTRRFSCDGRESRETIKSAIKLKELPRLSLDSKAGSPRCFNGQVKSNCLLGDTRNKNGNSSTFLHQQEPGGCTGPSPVVVKLMGLEGFPESVSTNGSQMGQIKTHADAENNPLDSTTKGNKQSRSSGSSPPRNPYKESISPRMRNADSSKMPSKFPIEPAPWKQSDGSKGSQTPTSKNKVSQTKATNSSVSIYGEIEKRLAQLEFNRSGKDLRALKQILEAMQKTQDTLDTRTEASKSTNQTSINSNVNQNSKLAYLQNLESSSPLPVHAKGNSSPKSRKSPIVIIRPSKHIEEAKNHSSLQKPTDALSSLHKLRTGALAHDRKESVEKPTAKDLTPRIKHLRDHSSQPNSPVNRHNGARSISAAQISKEPQAMARKITNSGKSSETMNLRRQQKQMEKPVHGSRQLAESQSPRQKVRPKSSRSQPSDDELSNISGDTIDLNHRGEVTSMHSGSNISLASLEDEEVSSTDRSNKIRKNSTQQKDFKNQVAKSTKGRSIVELLFTFSEQPSPVSVLDPTLYSEELPSPIKKISITFEADEAPNPDAERMAVDANHSSSSAISCINSAIHKKEVENIQNLILNTKKVSSTYAEPITAEVASLCNSTNAEHEYISQVLLALGLQKDFDVGFTKVHPAGYVINPELFLVLEQARANTGHTSAGPGSMKITQSDIDNKIRCRLLFDVVNEILAYRLHSRNSSYLPVSKKPEGPQLLGEICSEIDRLQANSLNCSFDDEDDGFRNILRDDLLRDSMQWTACQDEVPGIVLDIERMIFKDLIGEVVTSEAIGRKELSVGQCRQLCSQ